MHIYAFGSVCRGEIDRFSDIDLLAITSDRNNELNPLKYSIYSYHRIQKLWTEGNAFAWHLFYESKLLFSSNESDYIKDLGEPSPYNNGFYDCNKFLKIFQSASNSLLISDDSQIYDLSVVFLSIRNFSTCYALDLGLPLFSRNSAKLLGKNSLTVDDISYNIFERARILSTRGEGHSIEESEIRIAIDSLHKIEMWMIEKIKLMEIKNHGKL